MRVPLSADLEALKEQVIGCAITVHKFLGPGLLESIYQDCLTIELRAAGLTVERERRVSLQYRGYAVGAPLKIDLLVDNRLVVEVKAVERLHSVHLAQVITYLKLSGLPAGLLMNFNATTLRAGLRIALHPDLVKPEWVASDEIR